MLHSRRKFLATAATATLAAVPLTTSAAEADCEPGFPDEVVRAFQALPGDKAVKIYAPGGGGRRSLSVELNTNKRLFVASAIKTYLLCAALR